MSKVEKNPNYFWDYIRIEMERKDMEQINEQIEFWKAECADPDNIMTGNIAKIKRDILRYLGEQE